MENTTIVVHNKATLTSEGKRTSKVCKPLIAIELQQTFNSRLDAAEKLGVHPSTIHNVLNGNQHTVKLYERDENGNKVRLLGKCRLGDANHPEECMDLLMEHAREERQKRIDCERKLAEQEMEMQEFREWKAEREAKRKAEEARLREINDARDAVTKANERLERRQRMVERAEAEYIRVIDRYTEAENELREAELNLLKLEGKVKV